MANITLTNLPTVTSLNGTEPLLGVQSSTSVQITTGQIATYTLGLVGIGLPVTVPNGGTGDTTLTQYGLMFGNGVNPVGTVPPPSGANYVLVGSAGSAPTWQPTIPVTAGVDSVAFGTTGLTPVAATSGVVSIAFGTVPTAAGIYSPATNQIALSTASTQQLLIDATGAATFSTSVTSPLITATASRTATATTGAFSYGTNSFSDVDVLASFQSSVNSYNQATIQNTSSGTAASSEFIAYNDQGTASTNYATVGINSSGYTGTGAINAAGYGYFLTGSTDLVIGTIGANAMHFVTNSSASDAMTISSAGVTTIANAVITTGTGSFTSITDSGNITFTGSTGQRFLADFSNATISNRFSFQTSTTNGSTGAYFLPNGTSTASSIQATNAADPTNASKILIATNGSTDVQLVSGINGTGTYLPLTFFNGGLGRFVIGTSGQFGVGPTATVSYGTAGQVFISGGAAAAPSWSSALTALTTLTATGAITFNTTTNNQSYTTTGAGTITISSGTAGSINNMSIGATTASTGAFTTLGANGAVTIQTTTNNQSYTTTGAGTITISSGTAGSINNMSIGATTASTGVFTTVTAPTVYGGTTASSTLTLQSTSGAGTTDSVLIKVGNNGAVTAATFNTAGVATSTNWYNTTTQTATNTATLTAAQITGPFLLGTPTATASYTLPLASAVETALGTPPTGTGWEFTVFTTAAFAITLLTATGWTLVGSMATGATANSFARFRAAKTGAGAYSLYRIS